jgi:hypothetical protein
VGVDLGWSQKTSFRDCGFEHTLDGGATGYANAHVYANGYPIAPVLDSCWFENSAANAIPNNWFIYLRAGTYPGMSIRNCHFVRDNAAVTSARLFKSEGATVNCIIDNPYVQLGGTPSGTDDIVAGANDTIILIGGRVVKVDLTGAAAPTIGGTDTSVLLIQSSLRTRLASMNTAGRDALPDPQAGDMIFNSQTGVVNFHNGSVWGAI